MTDEAVANNPEVDVPQSALSESATGIDSAGTSTSTSTDSVMSVDNSDRVAGSESPTVVEEDDDHYSPKYEPEPVEAAGEDSEDNVDDLLGACTGQSGTPKQTETPESSHSPHPAPVMSAPAPEATIQTAPVAVSGQQASTESLQQILQSLASHSQTIAGPNNVPSYPTEPVSEAEIKSPLTPEEATQYSEYRRVESEYINSGNWDKFPVGSRMFIGNLPGDRIDTMELFKLFNLYGRLAQISVKRAYGFVQYFAPEDCERAMKVENGRYLRGCYLKLEVAQPQAKNRDHERRRSISPSGYNSQDRYRSRSPGNDRGDRGRTRRRDVLSRKKPHIIPEVQILMESRVDREFVHQIERPIKQNGMSVNYQWLQPRTVVKEALPDIVNQLIRENVFGLVIAERMHQQAHKVNLQVFHPSPDGGVRFDEYQMIDIPVAVELLGRVKREKMASSYQPAVHMTPQPSMSPAQNVGYYGMPCVAPTSIPALGAMGGALPNSPGLGLPAGLSPVGPMGLPIMPPLPTEHAATLMALQTHLDAISLQKVALALQQQAAMQQQQQQQQPTTSFMPQFIPTPVPQAAYSASPPMTHNSPKPRHNSGNGNKNFQKRHRGDRNMDRSADRGRAGPLPYGPVSNRPAPSAYAPQYTNRPQHSSSAASSQHATPEASSVPSDTGHSVKNILDQLASLKG